MNAENNLGLMALTFIFALFIGNVQSNAQNIALNKPAQQSSNLFSGILSQPDKFSRSKKPGIKYSNTRKSFRNKTSEPTITINKRADTLSK